MMLQSPGEAGAILPIAESRDSEPRLLEIAGQWRSDPIGTVRLADSSLHSAKPIEQPILLFLRLGQSNYPKFATGLVRYAASQSARLWSSPWPRPWHIKTIGKGESSF